MSLTDDFLGRPLASSEAKTEQIRPWLGVPVLGLDALASAAYGPEAALTLFIPLGVAGLVYVPWIMGIILALLLLVSFSYRQTISAYPGGGGSYVVAKENLGEKMGLLAGASLMLDYILNVAVAICAGVGALTSAVPALHPYSVVLCLSILGLLTLVNLRGTRETGWAFALPTYIFIGGLLGIIVVGCKDAFTHGFHPHPITAPPPIAAALMPVNLWLIVRAFASGCTAMTGIEAVSNGVPLFAQPTVKNAQKSLMIICVSLCFLLMGISCLTDFYHIGAMDQTKAGYQSVISQLIAAVTGKGIVYDVLMFCVVSVLVLSANTSFAGFPRLCRLLAEDRFLPSGFANLGRRLVYSFGIITLAVLAAVLLVISQGVTDRLIPLFAVGAFSAFTLSQAGMVRHWLNHRDSGWKLSMFLNLIGAIATAATLSIIIVTKFIEGAWMSVCFIPLIITIFLLVKMHYQKVRASVHSETPLKLDDISGPVVAVIVDDWNRIVEKSLRFALSISDTVFGIHVSSDNNNNDIEHQWNDRVISPTNASGKAPPQLEIVNSPYRQFFRPLLDKISDISKRFPDRTIAVVVPELVQPSWYESLLFSQRAHVFKAFLLMQGGGRTVVITMPWHIPELDQKK